MILDPRGCHSFAQHAREQYDKLVVMQRSMDAQYQSMVQFFSIDPKKTSVEELFTDLSNFRSMFMVSSRVCACVCLCQMSFIGHVFAFLRSLTKCLVQWGVTNQMLLFSSVVLLHHLLYTGRSYWLEWLAVKYISP